MSKQRNKGTRAETAVVRHIADVLDAEPGTIHRLALHGANDVGDVGGMFVRGKRCAVEVKSHARYEIAEWLREAEAEAGNADAEFFVVVAKPKGKGERSVGDWWVVTTLDQWLAQTQGA